jgi:hypothetical protein
VHVCTFLPPFLFRGMPHTGYTPEMLTSVSQHGNPLSIQGSFHGFASALSYVTSLCQVYDGNIHHVPSLCAVLLAFSSSFLSNLTNVHTRAQTLIIPEERKENYLSLT